jgi:hypothetical protein
MATRPPSAQSDSADTCACGTKAPAAGPSDETEGLQGGPLPGGEMNALRIPLLYLIS